MNFLTSLTFDQLAFAFFMCFFVREIMMQIMPETVAGPEGWLIRTSE